MNAAASLFLIVWHLISHSTMYTKQALEAGGAVSSGKSFTQSVT